MIIILCRQHRYILVVTAQKNTYWNGKRALFESLGFTVDDSEYLQKEFERQAVENYCNSKYQLGRLDENGQRINIDINFQKNGKEITFISGWMVRPKGAITCNTPLGG